MISVHFDVGKNRLVMVLKGRPTEDHLDAARADLLEALRRLQPPFDVLSDVVELESLENIPAGSVAQAMSQIFTKGVRRMVRVVGKSATAALHAERIARQANYHAHLAFSLEEAEQVFASR